MEDGVRVLIDDIEAVLGQSSRNIVKILLFDTCRVPGTTSSSYQTSYENFLVAYATLNGQRSGGDCFGGYWTYSLYKHLINDKDKNIMDILHAVQVELSEELESANFQPCMKTDSLNVAEIPMFWKDAGM